MKALSAKIWIVDKAFTDEWFNKTHELNLSEVWNSANRLLSDLIGLLSSQHAAYSVHYLREETPVTLENAINTVAYQYSVI